MNNFSRKGAEEGQLPGSVFTLSFRRFAVLCGVVQLDLSTGALLGGVHDAGVEGARIDMQAHCTLLEVTGIIDAMHGIGGVNRTRMSRVHLDGIGWLQLAFAFNQLLENKVIVVH